MLNFDYSKEHRPIPGLDGKYLASEDGRIYSVGSQKYLKTVKINSGYLTLTVRFRGKSLRKLVHRLVAEAFHPKIEGKPEVNHLNGIKTDNRRENLQWVSSRENKAHSKRIGLWEYNRPTLGKKLKPRSVKGKVSDYFYVRFCGTRNKWATSIYFEGKTVAQKRFDCEHEAAKYVNAQLDILGLDDRPRNVIK